MRKAVLYKERTIEGRRLRKAYDTHQCNFHAKMKHRIPRTDGLSNTITSFFTDNLVLIVKKRYDNRRKENEIPDTIRKG